MAITFTIASLIRVHLISYWMMLVSIAIFTLSFARCFAYVTALILYHYDKCGCVFHYYHLPVKELTVIYIDYFI